MSGGSTTKSVKFENSKGKSTVITHMNSQLSGSGSILYQQQSSISTTISPVKPSQLGLRSLSKPFSTSNDSTTNSNLVHQSSQNYGQMEDRLNNVDIDKIVWPQLKKKLSFRNAANNPGNTSSYNKANIITSSNLIGGAELFDTNEEKVTVL